ncbi:hypothetical protein H072_10250 [Dactylellina haptotyla CBS 200.50]|uniref:Ras-GAP domain-containing protein n=1 Tax=Dactylellina haptotyla (strain CBS 200.50) TaxID=1284197 RepID=S8BLN9_DACHA|nr:hypothetical protein H072_10250 [Dactylellina haptotyla CBS 200.50]
MVSANGVASGGVLTGSTGTPGRSFGTRPSSSNNSPERKVKTIRRSQSATMTMNSLTQFREMTIRPVPNDEDEIKTKEPKSSLSTPPRTPTAHDGPKVENRMANFPLPKRNNATSPTTGNPFHPMADRTIEYRTRGRIVPHSPSSSTDDTELSPASTASMAEISINTQNQTFRNRSYAQQTASPSQNSPSSPSVAASSPSVASPSAQISTTIYSTNGQGQRPGVQKSSSKLYKQRTLRSQGSNGTLTSVRTSDSYSNLKSQQAGDASKVLSLMKELRGKMESNLEYRIGDNMTWTKGFCTIVDDSGRLVDVKDDKSTCTVIGDLRGCQIRTSGQKSDEYEGIIEVSTFSSRQDVKLRPLNPHQYDCWLAALLCWQPIRPAGPNNKMVKTQPVRLATDRKVDRRRNSDAASLREASIIKVGKMQLWDRSGAGNVIPASSATANKPSKSSKLIGPSWRRISCILQENGEFKLYNEADVALLHVIQLSSLSRSAIQYLDPSVLGSEYCIGIYPHYSPYARFQAPAPPIYLALDTKILFEVWFVLLRAYTVPELYGPAGLTASTATSPQTPSQSQGFDFGLPALTDAFRVPRLLDLRIIEAKFPGAPPSDEHRHNFGERKDTELFFEINIDGDARARSMPRIRSPTCMWMEQFEFNELPSQLNFIEVVLKQRTVKHKKDRGHTSSNGTLSKYSVIAGDTIGIVNIDLNQLEYDTESEVWWPISSISRHLEVPIGEVLLKLRKEELVVLMMDEYKPLLELLQDFRNGLTLQIGQAVSMDLRRLSHTLLQIFQVSGKSVDWLMTLAEAEISGHHKEDNVVKYNFPIPGVTTDAEVQLSQAKPEQQKMDPAKRAQMEANLLFRGNSLLTKAVEAHMKRYGKEYMDETIGEHVKRIAEDDIYLEVDPMKCKSADEIRHNWKLLNNLVRTVWHSIYTSPHKCPIEVKKILFHIRMLVEEKFGGIIEGPTYSSVSGFLFLRFFCPAIMNPKLFGILKDHPGTHAQRTLTLLAKSLQGLANMTTFGVKEPWFEPMNEFLNEHSSEFKKFIDVISAAPPEVINFQVPPSYATPITIQARLGQASKEGFPSLPFLIDQPRAIGRLVQMWLKYHEKHQDWTTSKPFSGNVLLFHEMCLNLKERMTMCVERAENAERPERPSSSLSNRWEAVAESVASSSSSATAVWDNIGKENYGQGYSATSAPTIAAPGKFQTSPGGGGLNYSRVASGPATMKHGHTFGILEEDSEFAGMAAIGKNKLTDFVGNLKLVSEIKKKVQGSKSDWPH